MTNTSNPTEQPSASLIAARRELYSMAIHEAGHAVIAYRYGRTIISMRWIGRALGGAEVRLEPLKAPKDEDYVNAAAIIAAGPHAQFRFTPDCIPERYLERLKESLLIGCGSVQSFPVGTEMKSLGFERDINALYATGAAYAGEQKAKSELELPEVQRAVKVLADAFRQKRCRLSGKDAERIIKAALN